jgi:hypothetical protein
VVEVEGKKGGKTEPLTRCKAASHLSAGVSPTDSSLLLVRTRRGSSCRYLHALPDGTQNRNHYGQRAVSRHACRREDAGPSPRACRTRLGGVGHEATTYRVAFPSIMSSEITV